MAGWTASEYLDDSRHGVSAVQNACRAADNLDALDIVDRQPGEIDRSARIVHRDAVDEDAHVVVFAATDEERRLRAWPAAPRDCDAGHASQDLGEVARRRPLQSGAVDYRGGCDPGADRRLDPRGGDDNPWERIRLLGQ